MSEGAGDVPFDGPLDGPFAADALVSTGVAWPHPKATMGIAVATDQRRTARAPNPGGDLGQFEGFIVDM